MYCGTLLKKLSGIMLLTVLSGCSVSYSVDKSSDSISESLDSISASFESFASISGSSAEDSGDVTAVLTRFLADVSGLARYCSERETDGQSFERQLDTLALGYGITDWSTDPLVFNAIGQGLRQAGVERQTIGEQDMLQTTIMLRNKGYIISAYQES